MIGTLAWDLSGTGDETDCIDIDPDMLYHLEAIDGTDAAWTALQEATVSSLTDDSTRTKRVLTLIVTRGSDAETYCKKNYLKYKTNW